MIGSMLDAKTRSSLHYVSTFCQCLKLGSQYAAQLRDAAKCIMPRRFAVSLDFESILATWQCVL